MIHKNLTPKKDMDILVVCKGLSKLSKKRFGYSCDLMKILPIGYF